TNEFSGDSIQNCFVFSRLKHGKCGVVRKENTHSTVGPLDSIRLLQVDGRGAGSVFDAAREDICKCEFLGTGWFSLLFALRWWRRRRGSCGGFRNADFGIWILNVAKDILDIANVTDLRELHESNFQMESRLRRPTQFAFEP